MERNEEKLKEFATTISHNEVADLVYLDESGIDESLTRDYARAERGKQVISELRGNKTQRTSMIATWLPESKNIVSPYVLMDILMQSGSMDGLKNACYLN